MRPENLFLITEMRQLQHVNVYPVILAGGSGQRLWPLSQPHRPKQFLSLTCDQSQLQLAVKRAQLVSANSPLLVTHRQYQALCLAQTTAADVQLLLEPNRCNTAPAIGLAAKYLQSVDDPILLMMPSDHWIDCNQRFLQTLDDGVALAEQDKVVTFAINPSRAETGYGYLERGEAMRNGYALNRFIEKPNQAIANQLVEQGCYWNSGILLVKASVLLAQMQLHCSALASYLTSVEFISQTNDAIINVVEQGLTCPSVSIDHAVLELTEHAAMVEAQFAWDDLGSFASLMEKGLLQSDEVIARLLQRNQLAKAGVTLAMVKQAILDKAQ